MTIDEQLFFRANNLDQAIQQLTIFHNRFVETQQHQIIDINRLSAAEINKINEILGEGEISIQVKGFYSLSIQESVYAGIWRTHIYEKTDQRLYDLIEIGHFPDISHFVNHFSQLDDLTSIANSTKAKADGIMNALPLLTEIQQHAKIYAPGIPAHVINMSLLPLSEQDQGLLKEQLEDSAIVMLCRGYGNCRIENTKVANVWWVRYYNSSNKLILNTLEIVDIPVSVKALDEDIIDAQQRLADSLEYLLDN